MKISLLQLLDRKQTDLYVKEGVKNKSLFRGTIRNADSGFNINIGAHVCNDTLTYANREYSRDKDFSAYLTRISLLSKMDEITEKAILLDTETVKKSDKNINQIFVHRFYTVTTVGTNMYIVKLTVDELNSDEGSIRRAYNVDNIEISPVAVSRDFSPADTTDDVNGDNISINSISDLFEFVKRYDENFQPKLGYEAIEKVSNSPADTNEGIKTGSTIADIGDIISHDEPSVKSESQKILISTNVASRHRHPRSFSESCSVHRMRTRITVSTPRA